MNEYTKKLRKEIASHEPTDVCCRRSFLCGLLINAECGLDGSLYIRVTGEDNASLVSKTLSSVYGIETDPEFSHTYGRKTAEGVIVSEKLSGLVGGLSDPDKISEPPAFFRCQNCYQAFIAGILLTASAVSDPEKETRVEIRINDFARASKLSAFFQDRGLFPSMSVRKGTTNLLFKRNEDTESLIAMSGAGIAAMDMIQSGLMRDLKKDLNRRANCEMSNLASTVKASTKYVNAINALIANGSFSSLDDELRETAQKRIDNPEASLSELCEMFDPPISKSGLTHRLERIMKIYEKYRIN